MKVRILYDRPVSRNFAQGDAGLTCAYPQSAILANGDVACLYRQGTAKHSHDGVLLLQTSSDAGFSWSEPQVVFDGSTMQPTQTPVSGGIVETRAGTLLVTFSTVEGLRPGVYMFSEEGMRLKRWVYATRSMDGGHTWSTPVVIDTSVFPMAGITTKPFVLPNGTIFVPIEVQTRLGAQSTAATFSHDDGRTFEPLIMCADDPTGRLSLCDARFAVLPDGRLLMLLWTFKVENEETIEVHRSYSEDQGRTWSPPQSTGILGQITTPLALPSGAVIAASNFRLPPEGIRLWFSPDGGATWDLESPIQMWDARQSRVVGEPPALSQPLESPQGGIWEALGGFTFGTPDLVYLHDGSVLLTYYGTVNGVTGVRACRFRVQEA